MKHKITSLWLRMLLPVIAMTLFIVILMTSLFSRAYISMILQQETEVNTVGFDTVSHSLMPLIHSAVSDVRAIMTDDRVTSYARLQYASDAEMVRARISCRDFLRGEIAAHDGIYGLLLMRKDGSLFGTLPQGNFFLDRPEDNPLPEAVRAQILEAPLGRTVWIGPVSGADLYGFESGGMPQSIMMAAWKTVGVSYGECYALMLMDESIFEHQLAALQDGKSVWHLFTEDRVEFYHSGPDACPNPEQLIRESNTGTIFRSEDDRSVCTFSMTMTSPDWTLVREVPMDGYEQVIHRVHRSVWISAALVFLVALALYRLWLKRFMRQFDSLLNGIGRMGQDDAETIAFEPTSIDEFKTMQQEIHRTDKALKQQMVTIRRMERNEMEQKQILRELSTAQQIQESMLPHIFPPFPDRKEIDLYASMDPAREVGGDFYDFFFIDDDHLCLIMADVSGKGVPGALFMMFAMRILEDAARKEQSVSEILATTNNSLCANNRAGMFVTVWLGILEISTGVLTAANAGHEYPAVCRNGGSFEIFRDRHGLCAGAMEDVRYREYELRMAPGDKIFVYTDGVPEATAESKEMFGLERMTAALNTCADGSPEEILGGVRSAVDAFVGDAEQFDDLTMLCLTYKGPQGR